MLNPNPITSMQEYYSKSNSTTTTAKPSSIFGDAMNDDEIENIRKVQKKEKINQYKKQLEDDLVQAHKSKASNESFQQYGILQIGKFVDTETQRKNKTNSAISYRAQLEEDQRHQPKTENKLRQAGRRSFEQNSSQNTDSDDGYFAIGESETERNKKQAESRRQYRAQLDADRGIHQQDSAILPSPKSLSRPPPSSLENDFGTGFLIGGSTASRLPMIGGGRAQSQEAQEFEQRMRKQQGYRRQLEEQAEMDLEVRNTERERAHEEQARATGRLPYMRY